mmetsp:Transcript_1861/g.4064  ORF Transcript_1861/g.4064 Transcript_1861/m.4064 type:complete len:442 (+) Transcript_1861:377-1702(+)
MLDWGHLRRHCRSLFSDGSQHGSRYRLHQHVLFWVGGLVVAELEILIHARHHGRSDPIADVASPLERLIVIAGIAHRAQRTLHAIRQRTLLLALEHGVERRLLVAAPRDTVNHGPWGEWRRFLLEEVECAADGGEKTRSGRRWRTTGKRMECACSWVEPRAHVGAVSFDELGDPLASGSADLHPPGLALHALDGEELVTRVEREFGVDHGAAVAAIHDDRDHHATGERVKLLVDLVIRYQSIRNKESLRLLTVRWADCLVESVILIARVVGHLRAVTTESEYEYVSRARPLHEPIESRQQVLLDRNSGISPVLHHVFAGVRIRLSVGHDFDVGYPELRPQYGGPLHAVGDAATQLSIRTRVVAPDAEGSFVRGRARRRGECGGWGEGLVGRHHALMIAVPVHLGSNKGLMDEGKGGESFHVCKLIPHPLCEQRRQGPREPS